LLDRSQPIITVTTAAPNSIKPDILRQNIAVALEVNPRHVTLERSSFSPGMRSVRCWGQAQDKRFFAKMLLQEPYPVMPRVAVPWAATAVSSAASRSIAEQIEAEWTTTHELRKVAGPEHIAAPLGRSLATKTIVWQDAGGARLDDMVKRPRLLDAKSAGATAALSQAGRWLRTIHDKSRRGSEVINLENILAGLKKQIEHDGQSASRPALSALRALEGGFWNAKPGSLTIPTVLNHGDFMLANLRWNKAESRVFVVDFENFGIGNLCQDLISLIFDLRSQLLNPLIPKRLVRSLEKSFWSGYGPIASEIQAFVNGVATARVFYYHLPQALRKRMQKGGLAGATAGVYKTFLEPAMLARCREA
jgi:hypothetical protein